MARTISVEKVRAEDLFVTPEFKQSKWAQDIYGGLEVFVTRDELVPGHFGTYFGALTLREYKQEPEKFIDARYVQDCYHLHECKHYRDWLAGRSKNPRPDFEDWGAMMTDSETEASLLSECYVYLFIPGLRAKTFPHRIWMDRFLKEGVGTYFATDAVGELKAHIREERLRALHAPRNNSFIEHQISNFDGQNAQWCRLWGEKVGYGKHADRPAYRVVEAHMRQNPGLEQHREWLEEVSGLVPGHEHLKPQPFAAQALEFLPIYKKTLHDFGNHVLRT